MSINIPGYVCKYSWVYLGVKVNSLATFVLVCHRWFLPVSATHFTCDKKDAVLQGGRTTVSSNFDAICTVSAHYSKHM
jgi:hypothetical protein